MKPERQYQLALKYIHGIGSKTTKDLISYCGSAKAVFSTPKGKLSKIPGFGSVMAATVVMNRHRALEKAAQELRNLEGHDLNLAFFTDQEYPQRLRHLYDSPPLIYYRGNPNLNARKVVSIVGSRQATEYGKEVVRDLIEGLAPFKPVVVSGFAYGIDISAHRTALKNNLETWAIVAGGLDKVYPSAHQKYLQAVTANGALITEYPLGIEAKAKHFPARNRIIAGISDLTVVIEAAAKGGALITADIANSYNKEVFAVPGHITSTLSEGCNDLIKTNRAHLLTSPQDVAMMMQWDQEEQETEICIDSAEFSTKEVAVLELLQSGTAQIDELSWRLNMPVNSLASILLSLEFRGILNSLPGKKYKLRAGLMK